MDKITKIIITINNTFECILEIVLVATAVLITILTLMFNLGWTFSLICLIKLVAAICVLYVLLVAVELVIAISIFCYYFVKECLFSILRVHNHIYT